MLGKPSQASTNALNNCLHLYRKKTENSSVVKRFFCLFCGVLLLNFVSVDEKTSFVASQKANIPCQKLTNCLIKISKNMRDDRTFAWQSKALRQAKSVRGKWRSASIGAALSHINACNRFPEVLGKPVFNFFNFP